MIKLTLSGALYKTVLLNRRHIVAIVPIKEGCEILTVTGVVYTVTESEEVIGRRLGLGDEPW